MANVLCIYENRIATVVLTECFFLELTHYDPRVKVKFFPVDRLTNDELRRCDILYMIRPNNAFFGRIAKMIKNKGIKVIFFLDDDLLHLPEGNADIPWRREGLKISAWNSDIIVSSNRYICDNYGEKFGIGRRVIADTAVHKKEIRKHIEGKNERIKIVYAAGTAHAALFERFIKPILKKLDVQYGDKVSLTFMGVHPQVDPHAYNMQVRFIESLPLKEYRARIEKENFDIGLAPLVTNEFAKCKYFNKFIEYAMFGIVGIYSNTEPYTFIVQDMENGLLVGDDPNDWFETISAAVDSPELISYCRNNSYRILEERFDAQTIMSNFLEDIPELLVEHCQKKVKGIKLYIYKFVYMLSRVGDWLYKAGFYFKRGGILEVCRSVKRHIRTIKIVRP